MTKELNVEDFFFPIGSAKLAFSVEHTLKIIDKCNNNGFIVVRIEGGIASDGGFEARFDCIWDGIDPPVSQENLEFNNASASRFVLDSSPPHNAFIITVAAKSGYRHLAS